MTTLFIVRHGESDFLSKGIYQGSSDHPILSEKGVAQSQGLRGFINQFSVDRIVSSPLRRALSTAHILNHKSVPLEVEETLREISIGPYEGMPKSQIPGGARLKWRSDPDTYISPDGSKPLERLYGNIAPIMDSILSHSGTTLVVGHDHSNRALQLCAMKLLAKWHRNFHFSVVGISLLRAEPSSSYMSLIAGNLQHESARTKPLRPALMNRRIVLLRHGVTSSNISHSFQGTEDLGLDHIGREQVLSIGTLLEGIKPSIVASSELARAKESADLLPVHKSTKRVIDERLNEYDYGHWTGMTRDEVSIEHSEELTAWKSMMDDRPIKGAEPVSGLESRVSSALYSILSSMKTSDTAVIVAHEIVLRVAIVQLLDMPIDHLWRFPISNGALSELVEDPAGFWRLEQHNVLPGNLEDRHDREFF